MRRRLAAVVVLAVVLRCVAVVHLHAWAAPAEENRVIARNIANGQGFTFADFSYVGPTTIRPPLYPFGLAMLYRVFGTESPAALATALAINVLADAVAVGLAGNVVRKQFGNRAGLMAAVLLAIWPTQLYAAAQFQGLSVAVTLALMTLWLCQKNWAIASGIAAGLAVLAESILLLPLLLVGLWAFRRKLDGVVLVPLALLAIVLPWAYRNTLVRDRMTLVTGQFAADLFRGNGPLASGSIHLIAPGPGGRPQTEFDLLTPPLADALHRRPEPQRDTILFGLASHWIAARPLTYAKLCLIRAAKTFWTDWDHPLALRPINVAARTLACATATVAWVIGMRSNSSHNERSLVVASAILVLGLVLASMFTLAEARNSVLMDVPQLLLGATLFKPRAA